MNSNSKYFKKLKKLPVDKFFEDVLYNKKYGYYAKQIPFGEKGDFITAPTVSNLFGEILGVWIISYWENLNKPKNFNVIELGPGNAQLSKMLIKTFKKFNEFNKNHNFYLHERSSFLIKIQKKKLYSEKVKWISNKEINIQHYGQDNWTNLVNTSSYTDDEGVAHTVLGVWEQFVGDTIKVYSGYSNNCDILYIDSLEVVVD
mgnify:CR=1 FL=1